MPETIVVNDEMILEEALAVLTEKERATDTASLAKLTAKRLGGSGDFIETATMRRIMQSAERAGTVFRERYRIRKGVAWMTRATHERIEREREARIATSARERSEDDELRAVFAGAGFPLDAWSGTQVTLKKSAAKRLIEELLERRKVGDGKG